MLAGDGFAPRLWSLLANSASLATLEALQQQALRSMCAESIQH